MVEALEFLVERYLGQKWLKVRKASPTPWVCLNCGPRASNQVKRNGHYRRQLIVLEGVIYIQVPQITCLKCGKQLALSTVFLPKRKRYWVELDSKVTELYLSGASYRQLKAMLDRQMEWDCGLMSLWHRFQKMLYLDEAYVRIKGKPYGISWL